VRILPSRCIHVRVQACSYIAYLHTHVARHIHTYILTYKYAYIHTYIHSYVRTHIRTRVHTYITHIHTYMHTDIHTYMHACMHAYIHTCMHKYIHTHTHARARAHAHTRTRTHTHTHTHVRAYVRDKLVGAPVLSGHLHLVDTNTLFTPNFPTKCHVCFSSSYSPPFSFCSSTRFLYHILCTVEIMMLLAVHYYFLRYFLYFRSPKPVTCEPFGFLSATL